MLKGWNEKLIKNNIKSIEIQKLKEHVKSIKHSLGMFKGIKGENVGNNNYII